VARKLRIQYPGAVYHVMNRGDRREDRFHDNEDRQWFLCTLGAAPLRTDFSPWLPGATSYTNQISNVVLYAYDPANRKTNEVNVGVTTNAFGYSPANDLLTLTDGKNHTTTRRYDQYGRVTNKVDALGTNDFFHGQWSGATEMRGDVGGTRPVMVALVLVKNWRFRLRFW